MPEKAVSGEISMLICLLKLTAFALIYLCKHWLQFTVFKINIFARNTVGHNNQMTALKLAISGPFRGGK